jgi:hypothetical protein
MTTVCGLDGQGIGVRYSVGARNFSVLHSNLTGLKATQPLMQWVPGPLSRWVKRQGHEDDHFSLPSTEIKSGSIPPLPHVFMA